MSDVDTTREQLAAIEHIRWADWQKYMHSLCSKLGDFDTDYALVIPSKSVAHWERQIETPYSELSDKEKASDMEQVDRYWPIILNLIDQARDQALDDLLEAMPEKLKDYGALVYKDTPIGQKMDTVGKSWVMEDDSDYGKGFNDCRDQVTTTIHQLKSSKQGEL